MRKHLTAAVTAATAAVLASGTGLAIAATHHAGPAVPAVSGTEHFQLMSVNGSSNRDVLIASGAFTAGGVDIQGKGNVDEVKLPGGTFRLDHHETGVRQHFDPKTCLGTFSGNATYKISGGTGRYAGISGSGTATLSGLGVASRTSQGRCSQAQNPQTFELIIKGSGPVRVP